MPTQTPEQRARAFSAAGVPQPIALDTLATPQTPLSVAAPTPLAPVPGAPIAPTTAPAAPEPTDPLARIESLSARLRGQEAATQQRASAATAQDRQRLNDLNYRMSELQARSIENQERVRQGGGDTSFQAGEAQRVARNDAIQGLYLSAQQQAVLGNITLAEDTAKNAVAAEFAQMEQDLATQRQNIIANYDLFTPEQKKRADQALLAIDKDDQFVAEQKENKKQIQSLAVQLASYGVGQDIIFQVQKAADFDDAISTAAPYLQSPEAKLSLEKMRLDIALAKESIATQRATRAAIGQKAVEERVVAVKEATKDIRKQNDRINDLNRLLSHPGLNSSVGTNPLGRFAIADYWSGAKSDFAASVDTIISQDFLNTLIDVKGQGATFGALTDREGTAIRAAANKLELYAVRDDLGKVKYFKASEEDVRDEIIRIQESAKLIREAAAESVGIEDVLSGSEINAIAGWYNTPTITNPSSTAPVLTSYLPQ